MALRHQQQQMAVEAMKKWRSAFFCSPGLSLFRFFFEWAKKKNAVGTKG
jgi:hypothetical protein